MTCRRLRFLVLVSLVCAACYDFVEPDFPEAGAPAVLQASVFADESGSISINALLVPGLGIGGFQRNVLRDTLDIYGVALAPKAVRKNGSREYNFSETRPRAALTRPFDVSAPRVEDVPGTPPSVEWFPIRRADPDTIVWKRGTDLILRVDTALGRSQPVPAIRQWFLTLTGTAVSFRISSDGLPPATIRIPPEFIPASTGSIQVLLSLYQAGLLQSPTRDYLANLSFNFQIRWIVRVT